jgi:hypothetical protein
VEQAIGYAESLLPSRVKNLLTDGQNIKIEADAQGIYGETNACPSLHSPDIQVFGAAKNGTPYTFNASA